MEAVATLDGLQLGTLAGVGPTGGAVASLNKSDDSFDYTFLYSNVSLRVLAYLRSADPNSCSDRLIVYRLTMPNGARIRYAVDVDFLDPHNPAHNELWRGATSSDQTHGVMRMDCTASLSGAHTPEVRNSAPDRVVFACTECGREWLC